MKKFLKLADDDYLRIDRIARVQFGIERVPEIVPGTVYSEMTYRDGPPCVWIWFAEEKEPLASTDPEVIKAARDLVEHTNV